MKTTILFLLLFLSGQLLIAQHFDIEFQQCYGGSSTDYPTSILKIDSGFVSLGYSSSNDGDVSFNYGEGDFWLVRSAANGQILWEKSYGGGASEGPATVLSTPDKGFFLFGETFSNDGDVALNKGGCDYWLVKTDSLGNLEWEQSYGGSMNDIAYKAIIAHDGGYILTGMVHSSNGDISFNHGLTDAWVVKTDTAGNLEWEHSYGGTDFDQGNSISRTTDGGYIIGGTTGSNDGDVQCTKGLSNAMVIKIDALGEIQWQRCYGGSYFDHAADIIQTDDGGYIFLGGTTSNDGDVIGYHGIPGEANTRDKWVVKLDASGQIEWQRCLGGLGSDKPKTIRQLNDGGYLVGGSSSSRDGDVTCNQSGSGLNTVMLYKLSPSGEIEWTKCLGSYGNNFLGDMHIYSDNHFLLAASTYRNDIDVDCDFKGQSDFWMVDIMDTTVSLKEEKKQEIRLYPNPASNHIWLQLPENTSLAQAQIELYSPAGKLLHNAKPSSHFHKIDVAHLPKGLYLVRLWDGERWYVEKLVVR
ncbi:MAG: T9SS type A sorting domain-containing protein [Bacteroidales bacterium]|nr:T9SS type A sorting domain-containing protein [Bacteroidales bacterium]